MSGKSIGMSASLVSALRLAYWPRLDLSLELCSALSVVRDNRENNVPPYSCQLKNTNTHCVRVVDDLVFVQQTTEGVNQSQEGSAQVGFQNTLNLLFKSGIHLVFPLVA